MTIQNILRDIFDNSIVKVNKQADKGLDRSALWRSFVVEIPDAGSFKYGFIYTDRGITEFDPDSQNIQPTIKMVMAYSTFSAILKKQISITDAIYYGYVNCVGENALLHTNILMAVFGSMVA